MKGQGRRKVRGIVRGRVREKVRGNEGKVRGKVRGVRAWVSCPLWSIVVYQVGRG